MRRSFAEFLLVSMVGATALVSQSKAPRAKLVLPAKNGGIVFDHTAHVKREKNDCKICHSSLFAQDSKAPLAFKPPHKNAEDKKASCGACHRTGGTAFELGRTARTASAISSPEPKRDRSLVPDF